MAQEIKNPAIITAVAWVPSLSQKLLRATSTAKTKQTKKKNKKQNKPRFHLGPKSLLSIQPEAGLVTNTKSLLLVHSVLIQHER